MALNLDGQLNQLEQRLREILAGKTGFGTEAKQKQHLVNHFKKFDYNQNGVLTPEEFKTALKFFNFDLPDNIMQAFFERWDKDNSQDITFEEFSAMLYNTGPRPKARPELSKTSPVPPSPKRVDPMAGILSQDGWTASTVPTPKQAAPAAAARTPSKSTPKSAPKPAVSRAQSGMNGEPASEFDKMILQSLRTKLTERGSIHAIKKLAMVFKVFDDNGDRKLTVYELQEGLNNFGIHISKKDADILFNILDRHKDGVVTFDEFMYAIRGEINEFRQGWIRKAFAVLDKTGDGVVTIADLQGTYNTSSHPKVKDGKMTHEECLLEFMKQWDTIEADGKVTTEEFIEYYKNVSASIDTDKYFEAMIKNAWHLEGSGSSKRVMVTHSDDTTEVVELIGAMSLNLKDDKAVRAQLSKQGVKDIKDFAI